jgi:hypothetical protein
VVAILAAELAGLVAADAFADALQLAAEDS